MKTLQKKILRYVLYFLGGFAALIVVLLILRAIITDPELALEPLPLEELLDRPTDMIEFPGRPGRMVVLEKGGKIKWFDLDSKTIGGLILDISDRVEAVSTEEGLLGITFHPQFPETPYFYIFYNSPDAVHSVLSRWTLDLESMTAAHSSEKRLLEVEKPKPGHNGGQLVIGPDGYLYVSVGDGGRGFGAEDLTVFLGKILRVDISEPDSERGYSIPSDNPFAQASDDTRREIWAYGFRNPWRFSFDSETGQLFAGDVGDISYEEVNRVQKGKHHGWPHLEGQDCHRDRPKCDKSLYEQPIGSFSSTFIRTIIGGFVYRGEELSWLEGQYVFGDFFRGLYSLDADITETDTFPNLLLHEPVSSHPKLKDQRVLITSMAQDSQGELYVMDLRGAIYKVVDL